MKPFVQTSASWYLLSHFPVTISPLGRTPLLGMGEAKEAPSNLVTNSRDTRAKDDEGDP